LTSDEVEFSTELFCVDIRILLDWPALAGRKVSTWRTASVEEEHLAPVHQGWII
jgi:hypothetical protein